MNGPFRTGSLVILYLMNPREKVWGALLDLGPAGVSVRGLDIRSFDDWLRGLCVEDAPGILPSVAFYPLARVERILLDEAAEGVPTLDEQCRARTGRPARFFLDPPAQAVRAGHGGDPPVEPGRG